MHLLRENRAKSRHVRARAFGGTLKIEFSRATMTFSPNCCPGVICNSKGYRASLMLIC
jgi:hypothetical protein